MELIHFLLGIFVCITGLFVFLTENPVHSVLFLILTFFNSSGILLLLNAEFLALIFVIVYVGAIAVLFLFVVMMLNIKVSSTNNISYTPFAFLLSILLIIQIFLFLEKSFVSWNFWSLEFCEDAFLVFDTIGNIEILGQALYGSFLLPFLLAGLILLVAMLGAINLTLNFSSQRKSEISFRQLSRSDKFISFFK